MKIAVFLGSHDGKNPIYCECAFELGRRLALKGIDIIYGGTNIGTMGALARGAISEGGKCIGVFPTGFKGRPEVARSGRVLIQEGLSELIEVDGFPSRKQMLEDLSDCCIALPGSWGTMDEFFAYATSTQLQFNGGKRVFVLNINGYYEPLRVQIRKMSEEGFIDDDALNLITFCDSLDDFFEKL